MRPTNRSMPNRVSFYEPQSFYTDESGAPQVSSYQPVNGYQHIQASVQPMNKDVVFQFGGRLTADGIAVFLRGRVDIPSSWIMKDEQGYWFSIVGSIDQAGRGQVTVVGCERISSERSNEPPS